MLLDLALLWVLMAASAVRSMISTQSWEWNVILANFLRLCCDGPAKFLSLLQTRSIGNPFRVGCFEPLWSVAAELLVDSQNAPGAYALILRVRARFQHRCLGPLSLRPFWNAMAWSKQRTPRWRSKDENKLVWLISARYLNKMYCWKNSFRNPKFSA